MLLPKNFTISTKSKNNMNVSIKIAVFVHLYYEEMIALFSHYLDEIPDYIDVYISTSKEIVYNLCRKCVKRDVVYIKSENRGRDVAALLVEIKPYTVLYDYFCFVHDKREKDEIYKDMTIKWTNGLWNNMLYDANYINNVIATFEENEKLGLLLPPLPFHPLNNQLLFNSWGQNYCNTVKLAKKIGLIMPIKPEDRILSLGTMFWAKKDALKKLFDFPWKYSDFQSEPLPNDGTISHAIERILSFVAEDAGYSVAYVMPEEYASTYINDMHDVIIDAFSVLNKKYNISTYYQLQQMIVDFKDIIEFAKKYERIFIYGAGEYGKRCKAILDYHDIQIDGFLVSDDVKAEDLAGIPILNMDSFHMGNSDGIIVAVSKKYRKEILENLDNIGIKNTMIYSCVPD